MNSTSTPPPDAAQPATLGFAQRRPDLIDRLAALGFWLAWGSMGMIFLIVFLGPSISRCGPEPWADQLIKLWGKLF